MFQDFQKITMPSSKSWKTQYTYIPNASKFHNKVKDIFCTDSLFKNLTCYQEVPVSELVEYDNNQQRYDWYIEEINTVIELHGAQHYKLVNYGNIGYDDAMINFKNMQKRDSRKKYAAIEAGYKYVEISYKHYSKLDAALLKKLIFKDGK